MGTSPQSADVLLSLQGITKCFGAVEALVDVDLQVRSHEVVAVVGDNAAGKSTLAKIVAGVLSPDAGVVELGGRPVVLPNPAAARAQGVEMVFQDLALCDNLDVTSNLFLGRELRGPFGRDDARMEEIAVQVLDSLASRIPSARTPLRELSAGQRQAVAIARTLIGQPRVVVLDEPTAALSIPQTAEVLIHVQRLRDLGLGVVFISHSMTDVLAVADRVEVLRHGRNHGSFDTATTSQEELIGAMTGARVAPRRLQAV